MRKRGKESQKTKATDREREIRNKINEKMRKRLKDK